MYNYLVCIDILVDGEREHDTIILSFPRACGETELQDVFDDVCNEITVKTLDKLFLDSYNEVPCVVSEIVCDKLGGEVSQYAFPLTLHGSYCVDSRISL